MSEALEKCLTPSASARRNVDVPCCTHVGQASHGVARSWMLTSLASALLAQGPSITVNLHGNQRRHGA